MYLSSDHSAKNGRLNTSHDQVLLTLGDERSPASIASRYKINSNKDQNNRSVQMNSSLILNSRKDPITSPCFGTVSRDKEKKNMNVYGRNNFSGGSDDVYVNKIFNTPYRTNQANKGERAKNDKYTYPKEDENMCNE